jgi:hypothetical protein
MKRQATHLVESPVINSGVCSETGLRMSKERSDRFYREWHRLADACESLSAIARHFPKCDLSADDIDPATTVKAFAALMARQNEILYAMMECEEHTMDDFREEAR